MTPTLGTTVLYADSDGITCAAIIAHVGAGGACNLTVCNPDGATRGVQGVTYDPSGAPGTWRERPA